MSFSNISELELAKIFVNAKKRKIEELLDVKDLDTFTAAEILCGFIRKNNDRFFANYLNRYTSLFDEAFFYMAINELKSAMANGTNLDGGPRFSEPDIMYVS